MLYLYIYLTCSLVLASADGLANAVSVGNIMKHLQAFQNIANAPGNKGSRGVAEGYDQCLDYVRNTLSKTGCQVRLKSWRGESLFVAGFVALGPEC